MKRCQSDFSVLYNFDDSVIDDRESRIFLRTDHVLAISMYRVFQKWPLLVFYFPVILIIISKR